MPDPQKNITMKTTFLSLVLALFTGTIFAQNPSFNWVNQMASSFSIFTIEIASDHKGNVYTTGFFHGTVDFDPGPGTNNITSLGPDDAFVQKLDRTGASVWVATMEGTQQGRAMSIDVDSTGNVYLTGSFEGTVDFDPGPGIHNLSSNGLTDIFVQKLDSSGNLLWVKQMGGPNRDRARGITADTDGMVYVTGNFQDTIDLDPGAAVSNFFSNGLRDIFVQKLDSNGDLIWARQMGGPGEDRGISISVDTSGNVCTTGRFEQTVDFDPGSGQSNFTSNGNQDIVVLKLSPTGNYLWAKHVGGISIDWSYDITNDVHGNVYSTGYFTNTVDFDPGPGTNNLTAGALGGDAYIQKLDPNGTLVWVQQLGSSSDDGGWDISCDDSSNVYTTGFFSNTIDFDPGPNNYNLTSNGSTDIFIHKSDPMGNFVWAQKFGGTTSDGATAISVDSKGNVHTAGYFGATVDFNPGPGTSNLTSTVGSDDFVLKLSQCTSTGITLDQNPLPDLTIACGLSNPIVPTVTTSCGNVLPASTTTPFPIVAPGTTTITWNYSDGSGNTLSQTQNVTIADTSPPVPTIANLPDVIDACSATVSPATATDNCAGMLQGSTTTTFPVTMQGTTVVTWMFADSNGNTFIQNQNVIIADTSPPAPTLANLPDVIDECSATVSPATATDNCSGMVLGSTTTTFPVTMQGTTVITWMFADSNGNTFSQNQNVILQDLAAPVPDIASLNDVTAMCIVTSSDAPAPTATDNCAGVLVASANVTFPITNLSTTSIIWTYDDGNGNTSIQTQAINWNPIDVSTTTNGLTITANNSNASYQWLDCSNNLAPLPGETNASFTALSMGSYAVEITENGCVDTSACSVLTNLTEYAISAITVAPNPSHGQFTLDLGKVVATGICIHDLQGRKILQMDNPATNRPSFNLDVPAGLYVLTVQMENRREKIKLVIE